MKVEIWSDVMCPFCYIGKRHFEKAVENLPFKDEIEVEWKSFQLNPEYQNTIGESLYDYLSREKGMAVEQAKEMTKGVTQMAKNAGLDFNFDTNIPANSFDAHRLIHLAKANNKQDEAEELLFKAHFEKAQDISKEEVLLAIADELGLPNAKEVLQGDTYTEAVRYDIYESQQIGVRGVPFFVLDRKYAVSGAQPVQAFEQAIVQGFTEWKSKQPAPQLTSLNTDDANACGEDGCVI